ncbi:MAG: nucleotide exchange factor GrpE [Candidatus Poribacteria bacterium]|nr:nucleotide exchange factor GrpE [Candidatus Poribacteria bacterium]
MEKIKLDADQQRAVEHFEGPALVVAGPGSGKTTIIKERILNLIRNHNVDPEHILAIAFTNAAVAEINERLSKEPTLSHRMPKICTLHGFGTDLVKKHYDLLGFNKEPDIWDADDIKRIIYEEKNRLNSANSEKPVVIYKFEGTTTGRCYIGQTTDPCRRELEHRTYSSNQGLREALEKGDEQFEFKKIKIVKGAKADEVEAEQINLHRNRAVVNISEDTEQIEKENPDIPVTIYKIKSSNTVTCCFGLTTDLEGIDRPEGFEVIDEEVPLVEAHRRIGREIVMHKKWAVLNREDPLQKRESNKRRIEIFCQHFNVFYDEVLKNTPKFQDLMKKFDRLKDDIENAKRQVNTGLFEPNKIDDPIFRAFAKRYKKTKEQADAIDFLDMLIYSANMLEKNPNLLCEYRNTHRYVFVDEFQDISPVDFRLIDLFSENLFAVGDDDQAIYGFRGGDSSIMQEKFGKRRNVTQYKITRNYRSTSEIVKYAKSLIGHNSDRICKNLHADNSAKGRVRVVPTSQERLKQTLLKELSDLLTTDFKKVGILARNWKREIDEVQKILDCSELKTQGFKIDWEELNDPKKDLYDPDAKNRRIMVMHRGRQKIEVLNIHTAKGREWDKVIFLVNTMSKKSLPWEGNDLIDERRLFYVAATRARQELVVLDGGNCQFVPEFQIVETIESQIKKELQEVSQKALETLKLKFKKELKKEVVAILRQSDELNRLHGDVTEAEKASEQMNTDLPRQLKVANETLLKSLIPVLDEFESQIKGLQATDESNNRSDDFVAITKNVHLAQVQLLNLLKDHGLEPIETFCGATFNPVYHEELSPEIYSNGVLGSVYILKVLTFGIGFRIL